MKNHVLKIYNTINQKFLIVNKVAQTFLSVKTIIHRQE